MKAKIGARVVKGLRPTDKPYELVDTDLRGFLLRVQPSGAMTYYLAYRRADGRKARVKIGATSELTAAQARDRAEALRADVVQGQDPAEEKRAGRAETLGEFIEGRYLEWAEANRKSGGYTVRQLASAFAGLWDKKLGALTAWDVERWRAARVKATGRKDAGNRDIARLKAALSKALDWRLLSQNPLASVKLARTDTQKEIRVLLPEEETRLFDALRAREARIRADLAAGRGWRHGRSNAPLADLGIFVDHLRPLVTLLLQTGIRRGEAFGLEWADVDLDKAVLFVRGGKAKSGKTRRVPLNAAALDCLKQWRSQTEGDGLLFPSPVTGQRLANINEAWRRVLKAAGIVGLRIHDLRHTFATRALAAGADVETVRALLGHHSIAVTARYVHTDGDRMRQAVERLSQQAADKSNIVPLTATQDSTVS